MRRTRLRELRARRLVRRRRFGGDFFGDGEGGFRLAESRLEGGFRGVDVARERRDSRLAGRLAFLRAAAVVFELARHRRALGVVLGAEGVHGGFGLGRVGALADGALERRDLTGGVLENLVNLELVVVRHLDEVRGDALVLVCLVVKVVHHLLELRDLLAHARLKKRGKEGGDRVSHGAGGEEEGGGGKRAERERNAVVPECPGASRCRVA